MTILTDAVIEKAARVIYETTIDSGYDEDDPKTFWGLDQPEGWWPKGVWEDWRRTARAALEAVLPDIIEACATAVRGVPFYGGSYDGLTGYPTPEEYVNAIRSLSPKQKD